MSNQQFTFYTNNMEYLEVGTKSQKEFRVKGYISTEEVDRANEIVTKGAMNEMLNQIKSGNVKLDIEHSTFTGENDIPVGRIVDAGIDAKGLWVEAIINKNHEKFDSVWKSIKDGFLDAFSIAYKVKEKAVDMVNGVRVTLLKSLELLNVAITGNPVNRGAKMTESFYKSLHYMKSAEQGDNMSEEPKEVAAEPVKEEVVVEAPVAEEQPVEVPAAEEPAKVEEPAVAPVAEPAVNIEEVIAERMAKPLDMIKSMQKEIAELKSANAKLNEQLEKPILKSIASTDIAEVKTIPAKVEQPLDRIK